MAEGGSRERVGVASSSAGWREEPTLAPPPASLDGNTAIRSVAAAAAPTPQGPLRAVFRAVDGDPLGLDPVLGRLAELVLHRDTTGPLVVGVIGAPGSGKSTVLARLTGLVRALAGGAAKLGGVSPFVAPVHVEMVDATRLDGDPATALAARLHSGLRERHPVLARALGRSARDPQAVLREANDRLDVARRRLDTERRALDDAGSRRARLTEAVLYDATGSQVDAYARANRAGIERRLNGFGIGGDPVRNYKDLVQLASGAGGRLSLGLRSLWGFAGQGKLVVGTVLFFAVAIGLGIAIDDQGRWLSELRANAQAGTPVANWFEAHSSLLSTLRTVAFAVAALCIVGNLARAASFVQPIFKGVRLLDSDLEMRRRDLDGLVAHQTKRVDALDSEVERLGREVAEAERRLGPAEQFDGGDPSPFGDTATGVAAERFFADLDRTLGTRDPSSRQPERIVLMVDHLAEMGAARALAVLDAIRRSGGSGMVALVALDAERAGANLAKDLSSRVDVALNLDAMGVRDPLALVRAALGAPMPTPPAAPDARSSVLDAPVDAAEAHLLAALVPLAGGTAGAAKLLVTLYGLARLDGPASERVPAGALALMAAACCGGNDAERIILAAAAGAADPDAALRVEGGGPRLEAALSAAGPLTVGEAAAARRRASLFAVRPV